jgi:hypothetical protein
MARLSWFSEEGDEVMFQHYIERMESWQQAMADGTITVEEVKDQAQRVADLLRQVEGRLDDDLHEQISNALMEWAVLQGMSTTLVMQETQNSIAAGAAQAAASSPA